MEKLYLLSPLLAMEGKLNWAVCTLLPEYVSV